MTELPENLREFEGLGLFRPDDYVPPQKSVANTQPLPAESFTTRARHLGKHVLSDIWHSPRTRSYGLGLGLGSAAVATGVAVAFLSPHHSSPDAAQPHELMIMPTSSSTTNPHKKPEKSSRMQPMADPADTSTALPSWVASPSWRTAQQPSPSQPKNSPPATHASPTRSYPVTPSPIWSTMRPTGPATPENSPAAPETNTPPSDAPTLPLETSESAMSELPETPPTSLLPSHGD